VGVGRRHPLLLSLPLAVGAVGAGYAGQSLLRPASSGPDDRLLDALMAPPANSRPQPGLTAGSPRQPGSATALQAQRLSPGQDGRLPAAAAGPGLALEIRVALLNLPGLPSLTASSGWQLLDRDGRVLQRGGAGEAAAIAALLDQHAELWLEPLAGGHLLADSQAYGGRFRLLRASSGVQVVNHLPLETYISSVVGAEMPSRWNMEALRAQAVAARSYALAHMARPADAHWHLGDTTRWQAYRGLGSVSDRTIEAASSTAGMILSYQGGIVESLYAATSQLTQEAHGHLGASMSQHGAQDLAEQGLRYNEILGRYYQGASLARLQSGAS